MIRDPHRLLRVTADPYLRREKPGDVMVAELAALRQGDDSAPGEEDDDALYARLRRYRADEMVRLGVRELQLSNRHEVGRELAHLADACFDAAITHYDRVLRTRFGAPRYSDDDGVERNAELVVIGMGKLGGEELNFVSDVDVIYIYSSDSGSAGDISLREYFSK
ncbi:MAG: bifunctional [glutamate--ammonia ligase]-adenylyl-L-tyrosine phosphorylase/[glutamate--ammonia-ligase] adenylyltransferase, partial [Myxococcota bacterium]